MAICRQCQPEQSDVLTDLDEASGDLYRVVETLDLFAGEDLAGQLTAPLRLIREKLWDTARRLETRGELERRAQGPVV